GSAVAFHLVRDCIGRPQIRLDQRQHFLFKRGVVRHLQLARLLCRLFSQLDDGIDHGLEVPVAEHQAPSMTSSLSSFASDSTISTASWVPATTRSSWLSAISSSSGLSTYSLLTKPTRAAPIGPMNGAPDSVSAAEDAIILEIVRQRRYDHLGFVAPTGGEQRSHRAIDQPRDQSLFLGRTALALE